MKTLPFLLALLVAPLASAKAPPNIVMLLIDDMGWGDFSCFGNTEGRTPNIDRVASEGIQFRQFYVNAPICSPSRCAIITGQYPQRWKITSFLEARASNNERGMAQWLDPKAPTAARELKKAGYATGHFGKWHLGGQRNVADAPLITTYGYDESLTNFEGMGPKLLPLTLKPGDKEPGKIWEDAERLGGPATWMLRSKITTGYMDAALKFMDKAAKEKKPFYIDLWPDDVHSPFWPPVDKWQDAKRPRYLAVLEEMDRQLGVFFDHLRNNPELRDNTLLVICSDNGPEPGAGSGGPMRGAKGNLLEAGIRSPLIVWAPGLMEAGKKGTVNDTSVFAAMDFAPSFLKVANVTPPSDVKYDGQDLSATLLGKSEASHAGPMFWRRPPDRGMMFEPPQPQPDLAVRDGKWKLLCNYDGSNPQLYLPGTDVKEATDLAGKEAETVERLRKEVLAWHQSVPADNGPNLEDKVGGKGAGKPGKAGKGKGAAKNDDGGVSE